MNPFVYEAIVIERIRQNQQWGGAAHDDQHVPDEFLNFILKQVHKRDGDVRERLVKIAALSVAALESIERQRAAPPADEAGKEIKS